MPTVTACEKMCHSENKFHCVTYSYRYSPLIRDNCLLCDRPMSHLDYYSDVEPDRDYDIYSMSDDPQMCNQPPNPNNRQLINARNFFFFVLFLCFNNENLKCIRKFNFNNFRMLFPCN